MDFCPNCGAMILSGTQCKMCGYNLDGFHFNKLKIGTPYKYISDKSSFRNNYNGLLKLIINKNQIDFTKEDILQCYNEIINQANENFINHEKQIIIKDFSNYLDSYNNFIDYNERLNIESMFRRDYCDYYHELNMDKSIDNFNKKIIKIEKQKVLDYLPDRYIPNSEIQKYQRENKVHFDLNTVIKEHNCNYIQNQMEINLDFFDNVAGRTLDFNQKVAVLTDDDNTQIVAGAGTGKTVTIQAKVKYLIEKQGVLPEDILCISFSNSARDDLAEKLKVTIGNAPVDVRTFHSLGYYILGINGQDREVPDHDFSIFIDDYFKKSFIEDSDLLNDVVEFFSYYFNIVYTGEDNLKLETLKSRLNALNEYDEYLSEYLNVTNVKRTKEYVSSIPHLIVANYLFIHNIDYEYLKQAVFKFKNYDNHVSKYCDYLYGVESENIPDNIKLEFIDEFHDDFACTKDKNYPAFFLPEEDIYIDLALVKHDWKDTLNQEQKQNIEDSLEKRHEMNNSFKTKIITIFDYGDDVESLLNDFENNLNQFNVSINDVNNELIFEKLISQNNPEYVRFIKTIESFINLFKGNGMNIDYYGNDISKLRFNEFLDDNHEKYSDSIEKRNKFYLKIVEEIYEVYKSYLKDNNYIDFDDMINDAIVKLRQGASIHKYKYVIVDEYQDTSHTRYNLLKEVQNVTGAKVVVVGDDWQSIYGFTGCDVNLFSKFNEYFENPKMVKINITRRNSQKLINVAGEFIQENKNQIPKELKSDKVDNMFPIKIFEYLSRAEEVLALINIFEDISKQKDDAHILILGRNNADIYQILCKEIFDTIQFKDFTQITYNQKPKLNIQFRTVHKSKGLEADYVVVLNLNNQINGFPNKMVNDPILDFVNHQQEEDIDYPEERRLFYVALTRTRNDVYLFTRSKRFSQFIKDIKDKKGVQKLKYAFSNDEIMCINQLLEKRFDVVETDNECPKCKKGKVNLIVNNLKGTSYFRCSNFCGWEGAPYHNIDKDDGTRKISFVKYAKVCDRCGGMLIVRKNSMDGSYFLGCTSFKSLDCRKTLDLPPDFEMRNDEILSNINLNKISKINKTRFGVYYIKEYIPEDKHHEYDKDYVDFSKRLWGYKDDKDDYSVNLFTRDLMEFIAEGVSNEFSTNINNLALISVPSSKVHKANNSMKKSIDIIEKWYNQDVLEHDFNCKYEIINYKNLLKRVKDVPTAHLGEGRASVTQQIDSIECVENELLVENTAYIVLDDITTTGNSMRACNEILLEKGVNSENIYNIAIGATVRDDGEI